MRSANAVVVALCNVLCSRASTITHASKFRVVQKLILSWCRARPVPITQPASNANLTRVCDRKQSTPFLENYDVFADPLEDFCDTDCLHARLHAGLLWLHLLLPHHACLALDNGECVASGR